MGWGRRNGRTYEYSLTLPSIYPLNHSPIDKDPFLEGSKKYDLRGAFPDFDFQVLYIERWNSERPYVVCW